MFTKAKTSRSIAMGASWLLAIGIWYFWLVCGLRGAWELHHRLMWRPFETEFALKAAFVPITDPNSQLSLVSFQDFSKLQLVHQALSQSQRLADHPDEFRELVRKHHSHEPAISGEVRSARIEIVESSQDSTTFKTSLFLRGGGEWRWRYKIGPQGLTPIDWYEIHDTAGLALLPMALGLLLALFPFCFLATRSLFRMRRRYLP